MTLKEKIEEIRAYADTDIHPVVSPENWGVYAKLCDMLDEAAELEEKSRGMVDFAIQATDSEDVYSGGLRNGLRLAKSFMTDENPEFETMRTWIPVTERLPKETGLYMVSIKTKGVEVLEEIYPDGLVYVSAYDAVIMHWGYGDKNVQAWMPLPKPYQEADYERDK